MPEVLSQYNAGIMAVPCPACGAPALRRCRALNGSVQARPMAPHVARVKRAQGLSMTISDADSVATGHVLRPFVVRTLQRHRVNTWGELKDKSWQELLDYRNFGTKGLAEVITLHRLVGSEIRSEMSESFIHETPCVFRSPHWSEAYPCTEEHKCWKWRLQIDLEALWEVWHGGTAPAKART